MHERAPVSAPGASDLVAWFGYWPSFHDAEVLSIHLNRSGESSVAIQTWHRTNEVDDRGYFIATKHVLVTFMLEGIQSVQLNDFNPSERDQWPQHGRNFGRLSIDSASLLWRRRND